MQSSTHRYVLAGLLAALAVFHIVYFAADTRLIVDHDDYYLEMFGRDFGSGLIHHLQVAVSGVEKYPLVSWLLLALYAVLPDHPAIFLATPLLFYLLLVLGVYKLGQALGDRDTGLVVAFLVATLPIIDNHSRKFFLQHFATAFLPWSFYFLWRIFHGHRERRDFALLGLTIFLANLTHPLAHLNAVPVYSLLFLLPLFTAGEPAFDRKAHWRTSAIMVGLVLAASLLFFRDYAGYFSAQERLFRLFPGGDGMPPTPVATFAAIEFLSARFWSPVLAMLFLLLGGVTMLLPRQLLSLQARLIGVGVIGWYFLIAAFFHYRQFPLIGFTAGYVLLPVFAVTALLRPLRLHVDEPLQRPRFMVILVGALLLPAILVKAAPFFATETAPQNSAAGFADRRVVITRPMPGQLAFAEMVRVVPEDEIEISMYELHATSGALLDAALETNLHGFSVARLFAAAHGKRLKQYQEGPPPRPSVELFYQKSPAAFDTPARRRFAVWLANLRIATRTDRLWWNESPWVDHAASLWQTGEHGILVVRRVKPAPLNYMSFLTAAADLPPKAVDEFLAVLTAADLAGLVAETRAKGDHAKVALVELHWASRDGADAGHLTAAARAFLQAGMVDRARLAWDAAMQQRETFVDRVRAYRNLRDLAVSDVTKARFFERYAGLSKQDFAAGDELDSTAEIHFLALQDTARLRAMVDEFTAQKNFRAAERIVSYVLALHPADYGMRIEEAVLITRHGDRAEALWARFFAECDDFGMQLAGLRELIRLETSGRATGSWFENFTTRLEARQRNNAQNRYMLASLRVNRFKQKGQWEKALVAIEALRPKLTSAQVPGVNFEEAEIRWRLGNGDAALTLLKKNVRALPSDDPVYADSARLAAELFAAQGLYHEAGRFLALAARGSGDQTSLVLAAARVADHLRRNEQTGKARQVLDSLGAHVSGNALGLLYVELGKLEQASGNGAAAREHFEMARRHLTDPNVRDWVNAILVE